ncbi:hypothetical protein [uncultured Thiodictyon sp.]|uniref:hypothetical protein n=1 Tax=uncultured Thiodictyon sp. TaxID=1846217 RepID=UPI0025EAFEA8|nr:hypothetical protein [uncultured Thiodictyon sp.]
MNRDEHIAILAEIGTLQRMLAETPEEDVVDRASLTVRLQVLEDRIEKAGPVQREPARARLTFAGRPVIGSYGIFADFGAKAVGGFTDAVAAVAASLTAPLAAMGPIPNRDQNQLLITNTALGSFGFELEEYRGEQLSLDDPSIIEQALDRTQCLLQGSIDPNDEILADSAAELDQRALDKVRAFISTLADQDATCALQFRERTFRFSDLGQVRASLARLGRDNLHEDTLTLTGEFQGLLSKPRTFQFAADGDLGVITGKVSRAVPDLDRINRDLGYRRVQMTLLTTRVGSDRPRYLLVEVPRLVDAEEQSSTGT